MDVEKYYWTTVFSRVCFSAAFHPIEYTKVLIQIGHEPIAPRATRTLFGRPALALPNVFQYLRYIRKQDGFFGSYRGLAPKLCTNLASGLAYHHVSEKLSELCDSEQEEQKEEEIKVEDKVIVALKSMFKDIIGRSAAVIASQPFHVIAVRSMAQFVGGETAYSSLWSSIGEVFREDGALGFYSGIIPRMLGEISTVALTHSLVFIVNNYVVQDATFRSYTSAVISLICSSITYPFLVVSNTMAVNGCNLAAGNPPHMPIYPSWIGCWKQLKEEGQLKRGSSILWRYAPSTKYTIITPLDHSGPPINFRYQ